MARRGGSSTQRLAPQPIPNGNFSGLPPPSTIPAQIVQNATKKNVHRNAANKTSFIDQVKEFLRKPELEDSDDVCIAFVSTITNGGLDPLLNEDPFGRNHLAEQGDVCLDALNSIFQQRPRLLLALAFNEIDDGSPQPPIIIWLLPKLLGLLAQEDLLSVHGHVHELLETCINALSRSSDSIHEVKAVLQLYRSCVESKSMAVAVGPGPLLTPLDILLALKLDEATEDLFPVSFNIVLPFSGTIVDFWPDSQNLVALPRGLQRTLTSPFQALCIAFQLLTIMFPSDTIKPTSFNSSSHEHLRPWALDNAMLLWQSLKRWATISESTPFRKELEFMYIQLLETLSLPKLIAEDDFSCSTKSALCFTSALLDLIQSCSASPFVESNQIQLAYMLNRLRSIFEALTDNETPRNRRLSSLEHLIRDSVEPSIADFCQDGANFTSLHQDLQVCTFIHRFPICLILLALTMPLDFSRALAIGS
jgi:serine/threonine-protein kinase ATR